MAGDEGWEYAETGFHDLNGNENKELVVLIATADVRQQRRPGLGTRAPVAALYPRFEREADLRLRRPAHYDASEGLRDEAGRRQALNRVVDA